LADPTQIDPWSAIPSRLQAGGCRQRLTGGNSSSWRRRRTGPSDGQPAACGRSASPARCTPPPREIPRACESPQSLATRWFASRSWSKPTGGSARLEALQATFREEALWFHLLHPRRFDLPCGHPRERGLRDLREEVVDLLGGAAGEGSGVEPGLDLGAGQAEVGVGRDAVDQ